MSSIVDELRSLKELAINAATDTNTEKDREILHKMFGQKMANINDIADTTSYNGRHLLDGTFRESYTVPVERTVVTGTHTETFVIGTHEVETTTTVYESATVDTTTTVRETVTVENPVTSERVVNTTTTETVTTTDTSRIHTPIELASDTHSIDADGIYKLPSGYTGDLNISAQNVKLVGSGGTLGNVNITLTASGTNLWIENLNITTGNGKSIIKFQSGDNILTVKGTNNLRSDSEFIGIPIESALINVGGGLTIQGIDTDSSSLNVTAGGLATNYGALIGSDYKERSNADIRIGSGVTITATAERSSSSAAIGSGSSASIGNIFVADGAKISITKPGYGAGIGSGESASAQNIQIGAIEEISIRNVSGSNIGSGWPGSVGNITINQSAKLYKNLLFYPTTIIGASYNGTAGTVDENSTETVSVNVSVDEPENAPEIVTETVEVPTTTTITETNIVTSTVVVTSTAPTTTTVSVPVTVPTTTSVVDTSTVTVTDTATYTDTETIHSALAIHSGSSANHSISLTINDMHTRALGIDGADIRTRAGANDSLAVIDAAISYALNQMTNLGALINRLKYTASNLNTAIENAQAASSTIRDADMAREMTNYTRANILARASQSVLAQANQNSGNILGLIQ